MLKVEERGVSLGEYRVKRALFPGVDHVIERLAKQSASRDEIHRALFDQIELSPHESFLLSAVVDFISRVVKQLDKGYSLLDFERWLDQQERIEEQRRSLIRSKIVGRHLPREEYQSYFPIAQGRHHSGVHIVTAHNPPDLDTAVASFWGWVDAFGARVGLGGHQWNLPGGAATGQIARLFEEVAGPDLISLVARQSGRLAVSARDLATRQPMELRTGEVLTSNLDHHGLERCIIMVDAEGSFVGTWRSSDVEGFRTLVLLLVDCWRWFSARFYDEIVTLFAQDSPKRSDVESLLKSLLDTRLGRCEPVSDVSEEQAGRLDRTLREVMGVERGLESTFGEFEELRCAVDPIRADHLYDQGGALVADRPALFAQVQVVVREMQRAIGAFRKQIDRLDFAMQVKRTIFDATGQYVTVAADLDEVRAAIGPHHFLPVVESRGHRLVPVGVVSATALQKDRLGTVSLRDFCNRDEVKIADHLETISVVDHHRSHLQTSSFPTVVLGDVQSCNTLLAELSMAINERYAVGGKPSGSDHPRLRQIELSQEIARQTRGDWFVHPEREMVEYLTYLYAILDDTDLLSRVTTRDVEIVGRLINRMVSLIRGHAVIEIDFDDIPRDANFAKRAARRILENEQMYSLYSRIYSVREDEVAEQISLCASGRSSTLFTDTKEQKGCARVGQVKLFPNNFALFAAHREQLKNSWMEKAREIHRHRSELQLHIQMVSTINGAEEVYRGCEGGHSHQDEIWFWVPATKEGEARLASFLSGFKGVKGALEVELHSEDEGLGEIFGRYFERSSGAVPGVAVLKCDAGTITSRKTHITPYLPL